jgi:hypothetical protein
LLRVFPTLGVAMSQDAKLLRRSRVWQPVAAI